MTHEQKAEAATRAAVRMWIEDGARDRGMPFLDYVTMLMKQYEAAGSPSMSGFRWEQQQSH